jgi:cell division septum initiation protein DivIVA
MGAETIDLGRYLSMLLKRWKWIVGTTLAGVAAATLFTVSFETVKYEAVAQVSAASAKAIAGYVSFARENEVLERSVDVLGEEVPVELRSAAALRKATRVQVASDGTVINLVAKHTDRVVAAGIANAWAEAYCQLVNDYVQMPSLDVGMLEKEVEGADVELRLAEEALSALTGPVAMLDLRVQALTQNLAHHLAAEEKIRLAILDAESLRQMLQTTGTAAPALATRLSLVLIELYSLSSGTGGSILLDLAVDSWAFDEAGVADQLLDLDRLIAVLRDKEGKLITSTSAISVEVAAAFAELGDAQLQRDRAERAVTSTLASLTSLTGELEELRLATELGRDMVARPLSRAEPWEARGGSALVLNAVVLAILGFILGTAGAFVDDWRIGRGRGDRHGDEVVPTSSPGTW